MKTIFSESDSKKSEDSIIAEFKKDYNEFLANTLWTRYKEISQGFNKKEMNSISHRVKKANGAIYVKSHNYQDAINIIKYFIFTRGEHVEMYQNGYFDYTKDFGEQYYYAANIFSNGYINEIGVEEPKLIIFGRNKNTIQIEPLDFFSLIN